MEPLLKIEILVDGTELRIASIKDLIAMKKIAGRPQDLVDIDKLKNVTAVRASKPLKIKSTSKLKSVLQPKK